MKYKCKSTSFLKMNNYPIKVSTAILSMIMCGCSVASGLTEAQCEELSNDYDSQIELLETSQATLSLCQTQIGQLDLCTRTEKIKMANMVENAEKEAVRLEQELRTKCPAWIE